jgi:hypothetical protein
VDKCQTTEKRLEKLHVYDVIIFLGVTDKYLGKVQQIKSAITEVGLDRDLRRVRLDS